MYGQTQPILQRPPGYRPSPDHFHAPPTSGVPPNTYRPKRRSRSLCCSCCFYCCISLLLLLLTIAAIAGIIYLLFNPTPPSFHVKSLAFKRFNVTLNPDTTYRLHCETVLGVEARNPNKAFRLIYGRTDVKIIVNDYELGTASMPGFVQGKNNVTLLRFTSEAKDVVVDAGTGTKMMVGYKSKSLAVETEVSSRIGCGVGGWNTGTVAVKVKCGKVTLNQMSNGDMPECKLAVFNWINVSV